MPKKPSNAPSSLSEGAPFGAMGPRAKTLGPDVSITIHSILEQFRVEATSNRDLGDRFERLICRYLELDPIYADRFSNVWMWNEWPLKGKVGDVGIDLVAQERATGDYCAIQCKFYLPDHTLSKEDIDSFFTAAGKSLFTSCMIVSTTDKWGKNAEHALQDQSKPVTRLRVQDLDAAPIDWSRFSLRRPQDLSLRKRKTPKPHQQKAIRDVVNGLANADRGKLIMACGTGKTLTALHIAFEMVPKGGHVLFLVPSLSLLSQSLREWTAEAPSPFHALAVCSDTKVGKRKGDEDSADITVTDLAFPATTSARQIVRQYEATQALHSGSARKDAASPRMTVVFSTYQSIQAVSAAQRDGLPDFDLIICDEAHRTTGVTLGDEGESHFVKVHNHTFLRGRKRLYMTATPRIYSDETKVKAKEASADLCSMDDPAKFGSELHRLGFGEAVGKALLADYKVLVLAVDEKYVSAAFQRHIAKNGELTLDDAVKITGCWNGLAKRLDLDAAADMAGDTAPMRRAVAFSRSIKDSKAFTQKFQHIIDEYRGLSDEPLLDCQLDHVDGTYDALRRNAALDWLKAEPPPDTCRILSNARCLSEGVDVPALDAVIFLNPRNSVIDVVQSVGRVMRRSDADGKRYGYIILPIGIPADVSPEDALEDNEKYKVVWQVLQALRAHDDRFNTSINQIELNHKRPDSIQVVSIGAPEANRGSGDGGDGGPSSARAVPFGFTHVELQTWKDAIFARIVHKCGDRRYWESWAKDVAQIAERHTTRIKALLASDRPQHRAAFAEFVHGLRENINTAISEADAIEMLSQHLVTRPVFDALFKNRSFTQQNPVSIVMQKMLDTLEGEALEKETLALTKFYDSVRDRAANIDNAEGRQKVVHELYDTFFTTAFPKMAERLGIVYTPVPIVDFIIHSVNETLKREFNLGLGDKDVHIIDPFTGTGTFIVRLLQSGFIPPDDLRRKYQHELHANEIVLLAYYIAACNIEETFHSLQSAHERASAGASERPTEYAQFQGIVLTDTFQLTESRDPLEERMFPENNRRIKRQKNSPIRVVIGNPPYKGSQESENDANRGLKYPDLDRRIRLTYAERSNATNKSGLYNSWIRALRWASDRIEDRGIIGFVTIGSFIDSSTNMDGLRASLASEFSAVYVFDLRGNQLTQGEVSRMEGGKIFGSNSRASIAISILVKNPSKSGDCKIYYHDIGDYLSTPEKLAIIKRFGSLSGIEAENGWLPIHPNAEHDWLNQRDPAFEKFIALGDKRADEPVSIFEKYSSGIQTNRDPWCYNFSAAAVASSMQRMVTFYNEQVDAFEKAASKGRVVGADRLAALAERVISTDRTQISWSSSLKQDLIRLQRGVFHRKSIVQASYRPFCKTNVYLNEMMVHRISQMLSIFPAPGLSNQVICTSGKGSRAGFSAIITDSVPDLQLAGANGSTQCFPRYVYEEGDVGAGTQRKLVEVAEDEIVEGGYRRRSAIADVVLADYRAVYGPKVAKDDVFYYIYGVLHSQEYRSRFPSDLKKMVPRIPMTKTAADFWKFSGAGRELAKWHIEYESVDPYPVNEYAGELRLDPAKDYVVHKMTFGRQNKQIDKTTIHYNSGLSLTGIPLEAYEYVVNGRSAVEWVMDQYQKFVDKKDSGIVNDPNEWAREHKNPRYIVDLLKRVIRVSMETMRIVRSLPALNERVTT